jgi:hypothetical protein
LAVHPRLRIPGAFSRAPLRRHPNRSGHRDQVEAVSRLEPVIARPSEAPLCGAPE